MTADGAGDGGCLQARELELTLRLNDYVELADVRAPHTTIARTI